ncbi:MAG TPA: ankyrin repeat domain-containing protein [Dactylosporangium sp.]|nr:ankyrin repeat domain-containing protein [Dactylosporangium sp.]
MSALVPAATLGEWRRIRRYAVPPAMIEAAARAREAGDWRAACAAADVRVEASPEQLRAFADDLAHLAPDLVRWHAPRSVGRGDTTLAPRYLLALVRRGGAALVVHMPRLGNAAQHLTMRVTDDLDGNGKIQAVDWGNMRYLWDARRAGELPAHVCGPRALELLELQDDGRAVDAWAAVGVDVPPPDPGAHGDWRARQLMTDFTALDVDPACLLAAARARGGPTASFDVSGYGELRLHDLQTDRPIAEWVQPVGWNGSRPVDRVSVAEYRRPVDLHLLRFGCLSPDQLHPLVGPHLAAYWNGSSPAAAEDPWSGPVRVRCNGTWHEVGWADGRLRMPHSDEERRREHTLLALGGELQGCFAAEHGWQDRATRLPRLLEAQRRELLVRAQHGDLDAVLARLDAGADPRVRDPHRRTLLHLLPALERRVPGDPALALIGRLLAGGLDIDARDRRERTPLYSAVHGDGSPELVRALLEAGARTDVEDSVGISLAEVYRQHRLEDLAFLEALLT